MGKPFASELLKFEETYNFAKNTNIDELTTFVKKSSKKPLYVIGSGGSFSVTTFTSILHQQLGTMSRCITPLEFLEYDSISPESSVLILSASGNNIDILAAFEKAIKSEIKVIGIICASKNNKLTRLAKKYPNVIVYAQNIPSKKDGFLATNSLLVTAIWILRAYVENYKLSFELPNSFHYLLDNISINEYENNLFSNLESFKHTKNLVVLYNNDGKTAAIDLESKLVEAGLLSVQLADYRNFAHGRHNWLDKNSFNTSLLALVSPACSEIAQKTVKLIPESIPVLSIDSHYDGMIGSIELLIKIMFIVKFFGKIRNIDPGRPGVAEFGRKIYHLSVKQKPTFSDISYMESLAIRRKFRTLYLPNLKKIKTELKKFISSLENTKFRAIIFDYDGTLCDPENRFKAPSKEIGNTLTKLLEHNITIGVATGRGKSVRSELQKIIPKKYWSNILIGYYNGSLIKSLDEMELNISETIDPKLEQFFDILKQNNVSFSKVTKRPNQISIEDKTISANDLISKIKSINEKLLNSVKIVESSHSVDILSHHVSKLALFEKISKMINSDNILCMGDKAKYPGNDYELLSTKYSISVDEVNNEPNVCWNFLPIDQKGEKAVLSYLENIQFSKDHFYFEPIRL